MGLGTSSSATPFTTHGGLCDTTSTDGPGVPVLAQKNDKWRPWLVVTGAVGGECLVVDSGNRENSEIGSGNSRCVGEEMQHF